MFEEESMCARRGRVACLLAVIGLCALPAMSALAANEQFNYSDGALEGAGGGGAWAGPWQAGPESTAPLGTTPFQVQSNQMRLDLTDTGLFLDNESDIERSLANPFTTSSVYISLEVTPGDMGNVIAGTNSDAFGYLNVGFADNATSIGSAGPTFSVYEYYQQASGGVVYNRFGTSLGGVYDSGGTVGTWSAGNTYRLVGRLDFDAVGLDEQWTV